MSTFICIASGPSLTRSDCEMAISSGHPIVAINSSWRLVPECQFVYAADFCWWERYHINITSCAERWTSSVNAALRFGLNLFPPSSETFNSGQRAIQLAAYLGAARVILLGYDCSVVNGTHWHGEHPDGLKNPDETSIERWHVEFGRLNEVLAGVEVINCSRQTSLTCFTTSPLERVLHA